MLTKAVKCPIWGLPSELLAGSLQSSEGVTVRSARTGGEYRMTREAYDDMPSLTDDDRAVVTTWLVDQRRLTGEQAPMITTKAWEVILQRRPLKFSEKNERFFRYLLAHGFGPATQWQLKADGAPGPEPFNYLHLQAWMEARSFDETQALYELLVEDGYIHMRGMAGRWIYLTPRGFQHLEAMESGGADSLQAFVAMWFDASMSEAWRLGIAPGLRDAGYIPMRIDQKQHNNKIDDEIIAEIRRSKFLVADFTCGGDKTEGGKFQAVPRGGVYYEAGFAHGLGMEVVFTCHKDRMGDLHFDTNHFAHIVWETPKDLREQLYNRVVATVGEIRGAPGRGKGAVDPPAEQLVEGVS